MKFKIGDLALTQNSNVPLMNNSLLVIVIAINLKRKTKQMPGDYYIKRVDGQPFGMVTEDGESLIYKKSRCWCRTDQLRKPDEAGLKEDAEIQKSQPGPLHTAAFKIYEHAISRLAFVKK